MSKTYSSAPLPFMGQKRRFAAEFTQALKTFDNITTVVDLFGGSGLLSHLAKRTRPDLRVVYNDFDNYSRRLANVERTNALLNEIRDIVTDVPRDKRLPSETKDKVLWAMKQAENSGFVDYITLSASVLFSGKYATNFEQMQKQTMYNVVRTTGYVCDGYIDGLEVVRKDYRELFAEYAGRKDVVFLLDPPYLSTQAGSYECYWKLADYLDVLNVLKGDVSFFYFTSNKSSILELCEWISANLGAQNPFANALRKQHETHLNYHAKYEDIMLYRKASA